ncbi:hypothetical protein [Photobacterium aquimaris]|uniref:Uncharacterized protein n=1 Tax=Photobacterium aquimaris TaxID=512643 RepID=A0A2T3HUW7_9GAMM|nr:hypothetical protein [Photobacterium aquimaris]OBU14153.1 hypothetical protein AYY21_07135 [Photobacterium aquimaris]PQJ38086.1 hypothetical protein BTN98_11510 [Photobacterium aquimaris]PSU01553.1 hypothetical protein C0W81_15500 [Photobacterium aquimaris]
MQLCLIIYTTEEFRKHIQDVGAAPQYEGVDKYLKFGDQLDSLAKEWEKDAIKIWDEEGDGEQYTAEHKCYTCGGK